MKNNFFLYASILLSLFFSNNAIIAQESQMTDEYRENVIQKISLLIKNNYILKDKRDFIVSQLNEKYTKGSYNTINDFNDFGLQLERDLQKISGDMHFAAVYNPERVAEMRILENDDEKTSEEELNRIRERRIESRRKNNFGFHKVEILDGNIGYIDLHSFMDVSCAGETAHGAMAFLSNSDAIIIDLRNNYGGGASMYIMLASYFFGSEIVHLGDIYNGLTDETQEFMTLSNLPGKRMPDIDLYILTSKNTFSAAEEFAYDLKHLNRAIIVGEPTGGGAHMTTKLEINDEYYIVMPYAGAINPITKSNWEGVGVQPHFAVKSDNALKIAHTQILKKLLHQTTDKEYKKELEILLRDLNY